MIRNTTRSIAAAAVFAAATLSIPTAFAAPVELETRSKVVSLSGLDLSTAEGQAQLDGRLRRAAGAVCDVNTGPHPLSERSYERRCFNDALKAARASYAMVRQQPAMAR
ncbi:MULTISPECIES: UrcA family protein [Novosphingobium]|uniref:UrcA family protein n=1 Tax=Novosphingobium TaxID=165696 RepID=UPI001CD3A028|nr:UrcA family protein [Novosphingobium percolationis]MCH7627885.1 UrcA family protein [Pseudomonadota bacterium]